MAFLEVQYPVLQSHNSALYDSSQTSCRVLCLVLGTELQERCIQVGKVSGEGNEDGQGLQNMSCEGRWTERGEFSLEKGRLRADGGLQIPYHIKVCRNLFSAASDDQTKSNGLKLDIN